MAAVNYYAGLARGAPNVLEKVTIGNASAGTAVDVEVRMQVNNGTNATGLSRKDVAILLDTILHAILQGGPGSKGTNLPPESSP